jgi:uncharacterized sulfatase
LVMLLTDEQNFRTLSCYRDYLLSQYNMSHVDVWGDNLSVHTPNIDSLAKDGAMFTHFYTSSPLCTPSRGTFMTGMYPPFTGTATNTGVLDAELKTWAEILRDERGYKTSYMGKWHLDGDAKPVSILKDISCWKPCYDLKETTKSLNIYILHCFPFTNKGCWCTGWKRFWI